MVVNFGLPLERLSSHIFRTNEEFKTLEAEEGRKALSADCDPKLKLTKLVVVCNHGFSAHQGSANRRTPNGNRSLHFRYQLHETNTISKLSAAS